jgi:branched-subunit amino acid transport protein
MLSGKHGARMPKLLAVAAVAMLAAALIIGLMPNGSHGLPVYLAIAAIVTGAVAIMSRRYYA